jgi:hypothetical protein
MDITLHKLICQAWKDEVIPEQWEEGLTCPVYRKGDQLQPNNYRGITLVNAGYKVLSSILNERLQPYVEKIVGNYQCGFRVSKSTIDQIQSMKQTPGEKPTGIWCQHIQPFYGFQSRL